MLSNETCKMCNDLKKLFGLVVQAKVSPPFLECMVVKEEKGSNIVFSLPTSRLNSSFD